jgi:osmotically-inducible protein OsmY
VGVMEGGEMKNLWKGFVVASVGTLLVLPQAMDTLAEDTKEKPKLKAERDPAQLRQRLEREVRHELVMLPYYDVFDNLTFRVDGSHVILSGQVVRPTLKSSAENVVKGIEGVEKVTNNIEVLPLSSNDDRIRAAVYRAIYSHSALQQYSLRAVPPIHIIVRNGNVTLEGVVARESDKNIANIQANGVSGVFAVTNNLRVEEKK